MQNEFMDFLKSPNRQRYLKLFSLVTSADDYDPYSDELTSAIELLEANQNEAAHNVLGRAMPNLLLCPRAHLYLSYIAKEAGDEEHANFESYVASACVEGILSTGDGSQQEPYRVVRVSDEHDVVEYLDKTFEEQSLVEQENLQLDHIRCTDGTEFWFDITTPYQRLMQKLQGP
jgi:hypothetical protein